MPIWSKDDIARIIIEVGRDKGITERGIVIGLSVGLVESNLAVFGNAKVPGSLALPHDYVGSDGLSVGVQQMQVVKTDNGYWWGPVDVCQNPVKSTALFYDRLAKLDYRNSEPGGIAQAIQRSAFPDRYQQRMGEAQQIYDRLTGGSVGSVPQSGDPTWLEDVLRPALGNRLKTLPGWKESGVGGTMQQIWGIVWHHTGNSNESAQSISNGRPDLAGPLAQLHIAPDGTVTIVAVGPCNHAGAGSWAGLPTDDANDRTIGIECAWPDPRPDLPLGYNPSQRWPDAQIIAMRDTGAAITKHLDVPVSHNISHKEWATQGPAGVRQNKWDPGHLSMDWFRGEIAKDIAGQFDPKPDVPPSPQPVPILPPDYAKLTWDQLLIRWPFLGGLTAVEALGEIRDKVCGVSDYATWKAGK